jgi:hypothetical protein
MKKLLYVFFLCIFIIPATFAQDSAVVKTYYLGVDSVSTYTTCFLTCDSNVVFIQLHEDETTGIEAANDYFAENGGYLFQLKHTGERLVKFRHNNREFTVDPNRIFTPTGLKENLTKFKSYSPAAVIHVNRLAKNFLRSYVDNKKLIVALHNNTEEKFSILSYQKGKPEALNAAKVFINEEMDPDDFILTTDTSIYRRIKDKNINVVLQSKHAKDDGSLSIYTQRKKIPYINIEAQHGHVEEQKQMLFAIKDIIASYNEIIDLNYSNSKK